MNLFLICKYLKFLWYSYKKFLLLFAKILCILQQQIGFDSQTLNRISESKTTTTDTFSILILKQLYIEEPIKGKKPNNSIAYRTKEMVKLCYLVHCPYRLCLPQAEWPHCKHFKRDYVRFTLVRSGGLNAVHSWSALSVLLESIF